MADGSAAGVSMRALLERQKAAQLRDGPPLEAVRRDRLDRCIALLVDHAQEIERAVTADFGARPATLTGVADLAASVGPLKHARARLSQWMRPRRLPTSPPALALFGARTRVLSQPKGVVGVISPWNFPVSLAFAPLAGVLAAGNRAMLKPSEHTPATSDVLARLVAATFDPEEITVVTGEPEVGEAFSRLPFDHLVFTGATAVGRHVMRASAENLTPVTLELGGKSPVILSRSADLGVAAGRIMAGKTMNAGQVCLAPDYVLAPCERVRDFVEAAKDATATMFPTVRNNPDYGAMISQRHYDRVLALVEDARDKGAEVISLAPPAEHFGQQEHRRIPPTLILNATDAMGVMQEEIFGPVLPVIGYDTVDEAIDVVNARDRPLALYWFGDDAAERERVLARTTSGGVTVNDVIFHIAQEHAPFGGIGPSGMGAYHGEDGFREFSHRRTVYTQVAKDLAPMLALRPPYGEGARKYVAGILKR